MACPYCGTAFVPEPEVAFKLKEDRKPRQYRLEKPQPVFDETADLDNGNIEPTDVDTLDEVEDSGGATSLLESDDDDGVDSAEVGKTPMDSSD